MFGWRVRVLVLVWRVGRPFRARLGVGRGDPGRCPGLPWCAPLGRSAGAELSAPVGRQRRAMAIVRGVSVLGIYWIAALRLASCASSSPSPGSGRCDAAGRFELDWVVATTALRLGGCWTWTQGRPRSSANPGLGDATPLALGYLPAPAS